MSTAAEWLERIRALPLPPTIKVMNVCGGHERSITTAGLRKAIPSNIELVPGPGCPVCICPEEDIYEAIQLALHEGVILVQGQLDRLVAVLFSADADRTTRALSLIRI